MEGWLVGMIGWMYGWLDVCVCVFVCCFYSSPAEPLAWLNVP